ncbi:hypothetical protein CROQUDRAFT_62675 [Cronartium quercuum f. sp. fusiforme G11]|uniref:LYR motif-containing protein Cup1-like N-terminal domain-containing protein n=1 Tax=Cronartium quercuum f. sp. fusiforme G11 TaxID=708437 RepID=A0A9P6TCD1_9BASI|nr:hypothetical protein CROQUDRAFT_62675 [Cronartium quercuum f. sp. fusiforme G11]
MPGLSTPHLALARSYLREVRRFPDHVTRSYLLNLLHKRCRRPYGQDPERVKSRVLKTVNFLETIRLKIAAANSGHVSVFEELLKEAFARTGERRESFLKPFLTPANRHVPKDRSYPESEFPIYPPLLTSLLTSPVANNMRIKPSIGDLQSIPPTSVITNTWSDLPPELQPDLSTLGKAKHMGVLHPARQINHRHRLRKRWIAGLVGPPLGSIHSSDNLSEPIESPIEASVRIEADFGTKIPPLMIAESEAMLKELRYQANAIGPSGKPRYAPKSNNISNSIPKRSRSTRPSQHRIPNVMPATHPLTPTPLRPSNPDLLEDLLPKRQRTISSPPPSFSLKHGPRTLTPRLVRRRYQNLLTMIPTLKSIEPPTTNLISKTRDSKEKFGEELDRNWITPEVKKRVVVERAGEGLGTVGSFPLEGEDLLWLKSSD